MSLKYSNTTADYLVWSDAMNLIRKLAKDENYKMSLLVALGCFTGLRISDILTLRWNQILGVDEFTIIKKKTGKQRTTFGRQVYNMNSDNSELALVKLMELFNHSSVAITKRYLGLRQEEILETYDVLSF